MVVLHTLQQALVCQAKKYLRLQVQQPMFLREQFINGILRMVLVLHWAIRLQNHILIIYSCATPVHPFGIDATPNASFSVQNTSSTNTTETYFCNNSSNVAGGFSNVQWDWDFGDATTLSTANSTATKIYNRDAAVDKTYTITMKVTANSGCSATKTTTVIIPKQ